MREAAWLDDRRLVAIVSADARSQGDEDILAVYDGARIQELYFDEPGGLSDLRVSPTGRYFAARASGQRGVGGFYLVETGRGLVNNIGIIGYRAIAWSPDEQWVAVAASGGVFVFQPGTSGSPARTLGLVASDLAWRGEAPPPPLSRSDEVREWLSGIGVNGRLLVTQPGDPACRLRALQLPELVWAKDPAGVQHRCRFMQDEDSAPTFVTGGELFAASPGGRSEVLLSAADLGTIFERPSALEEVAWIDETRFWAVVRSEGSAIVALMTPDELVYSPSFATRSIDRLRVGSNGMVAASTDQGVVFFDTGGRRALTFPEGRAVAWAPGELIAAVATPTEVLFVAPVSREVLSLLLEVRDLEWVVP